MLADALSYAERFRPDVLLDYATLTGAVLIALGHECAALFTGDDRLASVAALASGEHDVPGTALRHPLMVLAMLWYAMRDRL